MRSIIGTFVSGDPFALQLRKSVGSVLSKMVYLRRSNPITLSTWIRTLAIPLVCSTSTGSNWDLPFVKAGISSLACCRPTLSVMVNPLSAITMSSGNSLFRNPQFSVRWFVRDTASPGFRHEGHSSLWCNANKNFYRVVVFIRRKSLCSG